MKKRKKITIFELIIVIFAFAVPSYLSQDLEIDPAVFSHLRFNITYIVTMLPQIAMILLIAYFRDRREKSFQSIAEEFGFREADFSLLYKTLIALAGTFLIALSASFITLVPAFGSSEYFQPVPWVIADPRILPLVLITCLTTGYREELIFRAYFINRFKELGLKTLSAALISALLFAGGHIYQGIPAFLATFCIGLFLGFLYHRFKSIHVIALGHGLYNFFSLILFPFIVNMII